MEYQKPKGTADLLPGTTNLWEKVEKVAREVFDQFGYRGIRTPMFEDYNVFSRNVGDTSDIVEKEMYDFHDKGDRHIALRPEGTAGVVRAYVENKLYGPEYPKPYKVYYMGPMFRYERPQSGRQREFHQIGVEALNNESPQIDVEVIAMAMQLFKRFGVPNVKLTINTLGDKQVREDYREALINFLKPHYDELSSDSQERMYRNPLRVLDSKDAGDQKIVAQAPSILDYLDEESQNYFDQVQSLLKELGIDYEIDTNMVRGLDYYNHTIFEIMSDSPVFGGGYTTVCAGGRYNGLINQLGGPEEGGIGFGMGVERLMLLLQQENPEFAPQDQLDVFFASANEAGDNLAFKILNQIRDKGVVADKDYSGVKVGKQIKEAFRRNAKYFAVFGEREVDEGQFQLKNAATKDTVDVKIADFVAEPTKYLR
ncbi:histidine--tRNA ligase [Limosilactobacillus vaginalis]|jgi:histidyl-tRNA synthetase|uniref:Histidine--tRNA ligase n=3 Tax=Limosilactobacillus vaginalis TaxID=1633 RepID=A0AAP3GFM7_9LACO|nr:MULTISPECIES: histidine--tRNA ligase [Limosilactobacillus]PEH05222.1 histidine--tRNA ligase [Lactobacillus sp. UMNPBX5]EEJ40432.1 histidine--tRNA ligase [Limosilactobacillus vaginalis DSM 5837 = ATCC 49540]KRM48255.1 histidine--tRNA ligase [Limosilactobacillus vaginalis DSM 5837 = ATCC 49540]MCI6853025.1 histidine--tRNA ligase [Limosilactobacillus vaginalis]MCZ2466439.1 histidine--tRNA ligase [Limosilactobacillus vaginalis]